jgi:hypothetical protein
MSDDLQKVKDSLALKCFGMTKIEAIKTGVCIYCKEPALAKCYSEPGKKEYFISGMCEKCFDDLFE